MQSGACLLALAGTLLLTPACDSSSNESSPGALSCTPGATKSCSCTNGLRGEQTCAESGSRYDACRCDSGTGGQGGSSSASSASTGTASSSTGGGGGALPFPCSPPASC